MHCGENKGDGKYTDDFRSVEALSETDTGGAEASGGDPFAVPDMPQLSRVEMKLQELEDKLDRLLPKDDVAS